MAMIKLFIFPNKEYRAEALKAYMAEKGLKKAVCFSCGHSSKALKDSGVDVLDISPTGDLQAMRWFTKDEIKNIFQGYFDATSGHLDDEAMEYVAKYFKKKLKSLPPVVNLPTGSGETLVELKTAFPLTSFYAVYNLDDATKYEKEAPLNKTVEELADGLIFMRGEYAHRNE